MLPRMLPTVSCPAWTMEGHHAVLNDGRVRRVDEVIHRFDETDDVVLIFADHEPPTLRRVNYLSRVVRLK